MARLFLAFANSQQAPLDTLQEEDDRVHGLLSQRERERHFRLLRESYAATSTIAEYLQRYQDELLLFHFGGHAGRDHLQLRDTAASAEGIAQLLRRCSKLRLAVLNGCSTRGQVQALLRAGVPVVIATSAPVGDRGAARFAIAFYQALAQDRKTIRDAFEDGIAAAQLLIRSPLDVERGNLNLGDDEADDSPRWGLYWRSEGDVAWRLPVVGEHLREIPQRLTYVPPIKLDKVFGYAPRVESLEAATRAHSEQVIVLNGMGGVGKSTLLKAWYKQCGHRFDYRAWIDVRGFLDLSFIQHQELLSNLQLRASLSEIPGEDKPLTGFSRILSRLRELNGTNLLMIDNAGGDLEKPALLNRLADLLPGWTIIATSRKRFDHPLLHPFEVPPLEEEEASALFREHCPRAGSQELKGLFELLGTQPLVIALAAKSLAYGTTVTTVREFTARLQNSRMDENLKEAVFQVADSEEEAHIYQHLAQIFKLADLDSDQRWLLVQLTALPAMHIKERHLQLLLQVPAGEGHKKLNNSLRSLYKQGWLSGSLESREFFLHRMLQWVVSFQMDFSLADCRNLVDSLYRIHWLNDLDHFIPFFPIRHQEKLREDYWLLKRYFDWLKPLDSLLEATLTRVPAIDEDAEYYRLYRSLALHQKETSQFDAALQHYKYYLDAALAFGDDTVAFAMEAFDFVIETLLAQSSKLSLSQADGYLEDMEDYVQRHPGRQLSHRASFLNLRGRYWTIMGDFQQAESCFVECLKIREGQIPANAGNIAAAQSNLALVLQDLGDYAGAKGLLEKAMTSAEKNFGPNHPSTARSYSNLAMVLKDLGDYAGAKELLERALASDEQNFGPDHPTTAVSYSNLALVLQDLGDYAGAKGLSEKAIASAEKNFGPDHPTTAVRYSILAVVLHALGDYAGAKGLLEKAMASAEQNFGPNHPSTARSYSNLAMVLKDLGDYAGAKELLEKALASDKKNFGPDHPTTAVRYSNLALVLQDLGDYAGAKGLLEKTMRSMEKNFGLEHPNTAQSYSNLALVLQALGDYAGAKGLLEKAVASDEKNFGPDHPSTAVSYSNLALVLKALGDYTGAKGLLEKAMASDEKNFGPDHPSTAVIYSNLALVLKALGDYAGAKSLLEKAVASAGQNFGPDHPTTAVRYWNLATVLMDLGDYAQARKLLEKALVVFREGLGEGHPDTRVVGNWLKHLDALEQKQK